MEKHEQCMTVRDLLAALNNPLIDPDTPIKIASDRGEQNILDASRIDDPKDSRIKCPCCGVKFDSYLYAGDTVDVYGNVTEARIAQPDYDNCRILFLILSQNSVTLNT